MNNIGTMAEMIQEAMQKKQGPKDTFNMRGGKASPVMYEEETSREIVMYESPNGEQVKIYGIWNELAVDRDEEGRDLLADENFPVMKNKDGEFVLDMKAYESAKSEREMMEEGMEEDNMEEETNESDPQQMMYGAKMKEDEKMMGGGKMLGRGIKKFR